MEIVGYETIDKSIWKPDKGFINTDKISKQGITKRNMNMEYTSASLGFGSSPHKDTYDILYESLVYIYRKHINQ